MALLNDSIRTDFRKRFEELEHPVKIVNFTQEIECQFCAETLRPANAHRPLNTPGPRGAFDARR